MSSLLPGYEYDIFISYRQKDNQSDQWVTNFVRALNEELDATFKEDISIYFDENPHDGLHEHHEVNDSLREKLNCLLFIPIVSQTYCDPNAFAWQNEFIVFIEQATSDQFGLKIKLFDGNVANRVLPVKIHDLESEDAMLFESKVGGVLRSIDFIYKAVGVNRPLTSSDERELNFNRTLYRDQINKMANAIKSIIKGLQGAEQISEVTSSEKLKPQQNKLRLGTELKRRNVVRASLVYILASFVLWKVAEISVDLFGLPDGSLKFVTLLLIVFFPISILMSWLYERAPQGFIRTGSASSIENPFTDPQKKPLTSNIFILLLLATVVTLFLLFPQTGNKDNTYAISDIENKQLICERWVFEQ